MHSLLVGFVITTMLAVLPEAALAKAALETPAEALDQNIFYMQDRDPRPVAADEKIPVMQGDAAPLANRAWWQGLLLCSAHFYILAAGPNPDYQTKTPIDPALADRRAKLLKSLGQNQLVKDREISVQSASAIMANDDLWAARLSSQTAFGILPIGDVGTTCDQVFRKYVETHPRPKG